MRPDRINQTTRRWQHRVWELLAGRPAIQRPPTSSGLAPADLLEMSLRLEMVALQERAALATTSAEVIAELATCRREVLGGAVDSERGSARLTLAGFNLVVASADLPELRAVIGATGLMPVDLASVRTGPNGAALLVFDVGDWTVVVAGDVLLRG